jgi:hypothetical protein
MLRAVRSASAYILAAFTASCVPEPTEIVPAVPNPGPSRLLGIKDLIEAHPTSPVRILFIHGMGSSATDYCPFSTLIVRLSKILSYSPDDEAGAPLAVCANGLKVPQPKPIPVPGTSLTANLYIYHFHGVRAGTSLTIEFLSWAPLTDPIKDTLLEPGHPNWPVWSDLTSAAKGFFQTHLSDAVIYAGSYRKAIRTSVEKAMCILVDGVPDNSGQSCVGGSGDATTVLITHSLGGYILSDAIADLSTAHPAPIQGNRQASSLDAGAKVMAGTNLVFMLANQLALLDTTTLNTWPPPAPETMGPPSVANASNNFSTLRTLQRHWRDNSGDQAHKLQIVAVSDPNDLLSYLVPPQAIDSAGDTILTNVYIGTTPNILGLGASPLDAHVNYLSDVKVANIIACGMDGNIVRDCR